MDSGSDAGEPGPRLGPGDLEPDEERLLAALERDTGGEPVVAVEDTPAFGRAVEGDAPLPPRGQVPDDGLTPKFTAPGGE